MLVAQNIRVSLGGNPILHDANLKTTEGELLGLIGPNGSGKSTLLRTMIGLLKPESGSIMLRDRPLNDWKRSDLARQVAYMAQGAWCHWPLSVEHVITLGRLPHLESWQKSSGQDQRAIQQAMEDAEVTYLKDRIVTTLSYGERTRVLLARALAVESPILLADEPIAGLDPGHQIQVMQLLNTLASRGKGIVVVLHDLTLAARFCHRLVLLHEGKDLATGNPEAVLTENNLREAYGIAARYGASGGDYYVIPWTRTDVGSGLALSHFSESE
jgi:iron complex transport system ATP-binding protein